MIATCPSCGTRYTLSDTAVSSGRNVRCGRCKTVWREEPPNAEAEEIFTPFTVPQTDSFDESGPEADAFGEAPLDDIEPTPKVVAAARLVSSPPVAPPWHRSPVAVWSIAAGLLVAFVVILIVGRDRIAGRWPATASLYQTLALDIGPLGAGLQFQKVTNTVQSRGGKSVLIVKGEVINLSRITRRLTHVHIRLLDAHNLMLVSWSVAPRRAELRQGDLLPFEAVLPAPAPTAVSTEVTFTP